MCVWVGEMYVGEERGYVCGEIDTCGGWEWRGRCMRGRGVCVWEVRGDVRMFVCMGYESATFFLIQ